MTRSTTWLLAGAALSLYCAAGAAMAAEPAQARAEAERDAAQAPKLDDDRRAERREFRIYRHDDGPRSDVRRMVIHRGEDRAEHLRTLLQLRPEQETALKAFVEASAPGDRLVRFNEKAGEKSTMDRLAEMESRLAQQQAATRKRIDATKAFYAQLDARQKKAFDAMPMLMMVGPDIGPMMIPVPPPTPVRFQMRRNYEPFEPLAPMPEFPPERIVPPAPSAAPPPPRPPRS